MKGRKHSLLLVHDFHDSWFIFAYYLIKTLLIAVILKKNMSRFYRIVFSFAIAVVLILLPLVAPAEGLTFPEIMPGSATEFFKLGVEEAQSGNYEQARVEFTQAIEKDHHFASAYSNRCLVYFQLENYTKAIEDCTIALQLNPNNIEAYLNRGLAYYRMGNHPEAIAEYSQVIERQPDEFRAYYNRGLVRFELKDYEGAIADYNQALSKRDELSDTELVDIYNDRGLAQMRLENEENAIADFSLAINLDDNNHRAFYNRACACHRSGDLMGAIRDFTIALKLDPNQAQAYVNRGLIRHELGYQQAALSDFRAASQRFNEQGNRVAYRQTLALIEKLQQLLSSWEDAIA